MLSARTASPAPDPCITRASRGRRPPAADILKVDNLLGFDRLVKLYLDNNVIVSIEQLDHLVHLEWLDLSFNNIETIGGLGKLTKLQNLSLFNNRIASLDGLEPLSGCLEVLSVGSNLITQLDETKKLRKFSQLHAVVFAGNEIAARQPQEYRAYVLAHLQHLRFLDYRLVDESEVAQALSDGGLQEKLQEIWLQESEEAEAREQEAEAAERSETLRAAQMGALDGFWARMDAATAEFTARSSVVEQLAELHARQRPKFEGRLEELVQANLSAAAAKDAELREYEEAAAGMRAQNDADALAHIARCGAARRAASSRAPTAHLLRPRLVAPAPPPRAPQV